MQRMRRQVMEHNIYMWAANVLGDLRELRMENADGVEQARMGPTAVAAAMDKKNCVTRGRQEAAIWRSWTNFSVPSRAAQKLCCCWTTMERSLPSAWTALKRQAVGRHSQAARSHSKPENNAGGGGHRTARRGDCASFRRGARA